MGEIKNIVVNQLKDYRKNRQLIALLTFELAHPAKISNENVIDVLNHEGVAPINGNTPSKTPGIAFNYRNLANWANESVRKEIAGQLYGLIRQQVRLETYINTMDTEYAQILRMTYMDGRSNREIAEVLGVSPRTVISHRKRAIDSFCELYMFAKRLQGD